MFDSTDQSETPELPNDQGAMEPQSEMASLQESVSPEAPAPVATSLDSMSGPNPMMRGLVGVLILIVVIGIVVVLSEPSEETDPQGGAATVGSAQQSGPETLASRNPFLSTGPPRENLEGNWVLVISQPDDQERRFDEICSGLFVLAPRRGNLDDMTIRLAFRTQVFPDAKLDTDITSAGGKQARIVFRQGPQRIDFSGNLFSDGIVYGNVVRGDVCLAARLMPTDQSELDREIAVMSTLDRPKLDEVMNKAKAQRLSLYDTYRMFSAEHSDTSLALDVSLKNLIGHADPSKMPLKAYLSAVDDHLKLTERWGPRMTVINRLVLSHVAFTRGYPPAATISLSSSV